MNKGQYLRKILYFVLLILLGGFMIVYGGYDDSPGGQLIGLVLIILAVIGLIRNRR